MSFNGLFKKIKSQSGRTMMEIIGVVALMGVLSLVGILGYSYAMEYVRENETLNRASKVIAGARTSYILKKHEDAVRFYQPGDTLPSGAGVGDRRDKFQPQLINMHDVISNIGNDFAPDDKYILAPLKGPFKDGTEQNVKIYVRVETPDAFTVRFDNLTKQACVKIVMAQNLGYSWAYESADGTTHWMDPTTVMTQANAENLCERVIGVAPNPTASAAQLFLNNPLVKKAYAQNKTPSGTLVLWFGPFTPHPDNEGDYPLCAGDGCCCELADDGKLYPVGKAGCKKPPYGSCVECTYENAAGVCTQKDDVKCPADEVCKVSKCGSLEFECGDVCCKKGQTCTNGKCEGDPTQGVCLETQTQCGDDCCNADEICNADGVCVADPCPKSEGKFWCIQDEVCCAANEKCQNGACVMACPEGQTSCGDECCPSDNECKESGGYYYCIPKCPDGETLYCSHDINQSPIPGTGKVDETSGKECFAYESICDEWSCTDAKLILKDPNQDNRRELEVPIKLNGKHEYCAVEINGRCALVTYCDDIPVTVDGHLQICPSCFPNDWSSKDNYDPRTMVCVGNTLMEISKISDGKEGLILYNFEECNDCENPCPNGGTPSKNGCCPEGHGWGQCGHCGNWPTYTDACGRKYPIADICCAGESDAPPGCTGLGNGQCYHNYPIQDRTQCCDLSCAIDTTDKVEAAKGTCCDEKDAYQGVCCDKEEPATQTCCDFKQRTWCGGENGDGSCCKDGEECIEGKCTSGDDKKCEELGGKPGYDTVPAKSQVKDNEGKVIEGCCKSTCACPGECCDNDKQVCVGKDGPKK